MIELWRGLDADSEQADGSAEEAFFSGYRYGASALNAFDQNFDVAIGKLDALHDVGESADSVDFFRFGIIHGCVMLRGEKNLFVAGERFFERANAGFAADDERRHLLGEDDHVAHRHHGYALHFLFFAVKH